ncbi:MAG TPA: ABC transporter permease subunit, partial [Acidimicrobiales bacterium]|nr:ABC transporter permease subunit [Acidimicrobiales bacterium]
MTEGGSVTSHLVAGAGRRALWARLRRVPPGLLLASVAVVGVLLAPLAFLLLESSGAGAATVGHLVWRQLTATLLWNTVRLTLVVTALCAVIGTLAAWCVERTDLPGRRIWAVLVVIPFAIPDFVISFGWASLSTWVQGFRGAVLVMTLAVYPLVYLPVAAALRSADPGLEETSRSLGLGRVRTFLRVTIGQVRGAVFGGCVLVVLVILAEYGAFEILGYQTFTTEIFTQFHLSFDVQAACALSLVLVALGVVVLAVDAGARGKGRPARTGPLARRTATRYRLGRARVPVLLAFLVLVGLALGVPVGSSVYWVFEGGVHALAGVSILDAGWHTAWYSGAAALLDTVAAVPVALLS